MRVPIHVTYRRRKPTTALAALRIFVRLLAGTAILYFVVTSFFLGSVSVGSASMEPTILDRDRLFVSPMPYGARLPLTRQRLPGFGKPVRGDVVVLESPQIAARGGAAQALDGVIRFFTLQRASLFSAAERHGVSRLLVKRVIGLPGDTVRLEGYRAWVKPEGETDFVAEASTATRPYEVSVGAGAELPPEVPFGAYLPETVLGEGEYFVLGDNRPDSSDSRSWGPIRLERIVGPVILRYFPFRRFGRL